MVPSKPSQKAAQEDLLPKGPRRSHHILNQPRPHEVPGHEVISLIDCFVGTLCDLINNPSLIHSPDSRFCVQDQFYHQFSIAIDICKALAFLHHSKIVHKNLRSNNILVRPPTTRFINPLRNFSRKLTNSIPWVRGI
jgi:hypothetical protein